MIHWDVWLAQSVTHVTLDLEVVGLSSMLGIEIENKIFGEKKVTNYKKAMTSVKKTNSKC